MVWFLVMFDHLKSKRNKTVFKRIGLKLFFIIIVITLRRNYNIIGRLLDVQNMTVTTVEMYILISSKDIELCKI